MRRNSREAGIGGWIDVDRELGDLEIEATTEREYENTNNKPRQDHLAFGTREFEDKRLRLSQDHSEFSDVVIVQREAALTIVVWPCYV